MVNYPFLAMFLMMVHVWLVWLWLVDFLFQFQSFNVIISIYSTSKPGNEEELPYETKAFDWGKYILVCMLLLIFNYHVYLIDYSAQMDQGTISKRYRLKMVVHKICVSWSDLILVPCILIFDCLKTQCSFNIKSFYHFSLNLS